MSPSSESYFSRVYPRNSPGLSAPTAYSTRQSADPVYTADLPDELEALTQKSTLYQHFLAERAEILRHKWLESEKKGRDIGFEAALLDWVYRHRRSWKADRAIQQ